MIATDERIRAVLTHPEVWPLVKDDYSTEIPPGFYLEPVDGVIVSFQPLMATVWVAHIAAVPEARGKGREAVELAVEWLRANTQVVQVLAMFPEGNVAVSKLVERCGFERVGEVPDSFLREGRLLSLHVYRLRIR